MLDNHLSTERCRLYRWKNRGAFQLSLETTMNEETPKSYAQITHHLLYEDEEFHHKMEDVRTSEYWLFFKQAIHISASRSWEASGKRGFLAGYRDKVHHTESQNHMFNRRFGKDYEFVYRSLMLLQAFMLMSTIVSVFSLFTESFRPSNLGWLGASLVSVSSLLCIQIDIRENKTRWLREHAMKHIKD